MILTVSGGILAELDVEHPVQFVFDLPMSSGYLDQGGSRHDGGEQEVADMAGQTAIGMTACGLDGSDGLQAGEVDVIDGDDAGTASFAAVMVILTGLQTPDRVAEGRPGNAAKRGGLSAPPPARAIATKVSRSARSARVDTMSYGYSHLY